jgi:hypothetical protein
MTDPVLRNSKPASLTQFCHFPQQSNHMHIKDLKSETNCERSRRCRPIHIMFCVVERGPYLTTEESYVSATLLCWHDLYWLTRIQTGGADIYAHKLRLLHA